MKPLPKTSQRLCQDVNPDLPDAGVDSLTSRARYVPEKLEQEEDEESSRPQQRVLQMPQEREQLPSLPAQVAKPGWLVWAGSAYQSWCPAVAMPTPRLCLRMLYLISHVWNSNYVISQHRVAMTAGPTFPGWLTPWGRRRGPLAPPTNLNSEAP